MEVSIHCRSLQSVNTPSYSCTLFTEQRLLCVVGPTWTAPADRVDGDECDGRVHRTGASPVTDAPAMVDDGAMPPATPPLLMLLMLHYLSVAACQQQCTCVEPEHCTYSFLDA